MRYIVAVLIAVGIDSGMFACVAGTAFCEPRSRQGRTSLVTRKTVSGFCKRTRTRGYSGTPACGRFAPARTRQRSATVV